MQEKQSKVAKKKQEEAVNVDGKNDRKAEEFARIMGENSENSQKVAKQMVQKCQKKR